MRKWIAGMAALGALLPAACSKSPNSPSVSFAAPVATQPANGTTVKYSAQPITLTISNAVRTGAANVTYTVEVSNDPGFGNKVYTKDAVPEGTSGTTSLQISTLPGAATYYWHWKANVDGVAGEPSPSQSFLLQPQIIISVPGVVTPANGATADSRPTFVVNNAARTGPAGTIFYEFQVATSAAFTTIIASSPPIQEQANRTSWTPKDALPTAPVFWRVRATDPSSTETSGFTDATSFTVVPFSLKQAIILNNPPDLAEWAETANITLIDYSSGRIVVDFDRRLGGNRWPDVGFGDGDLEYTLGMCLNIRNQWYCSAAIQFWHGRELTEGGDPNLIGADWFYDPRWGAMAGYQPARGELVGFFVAAGNLRDLGNVKIKERSNVVLVPFGQNYSK